MASKASENHDINGSAAPDILDAVDNLMEAGVEEKQAKAIVRMQYSLVNLHLTTKGRIETALEKLKEDIEDKRIILDKKLTKKIVFSMLIGVTATGLYISDSLPPTLIDYLQEYLRENPPELRSSTHLSTHPN